MLRETFNSCLLVGCLSLTTAAATAQEVVHPLSGTVSSINPAAKTITIHTDDGSPGVFAVLTKSNVSLEFDKQVRD